MKELLTLGIDEIIPPLHESRKSIDEENIQNLADSIKKVGVIQPITVRRHYDKYEVIAGFRRYYATKLSGVQTIPAILVQANGSEVDVMRLTENWHREDVNPLDEAEYFATISERDNLSVDDLSEMTGRSISYISTRLSLKAMPDILQQAMRDNIINMSVALELSKITDIDEVERLLHYAMSGNASVSTVRQWRIDWELRQGLRKQNDTAPVERALKEQLKFPAETCYVCKSQIEWFERHLIPVCIKCEQHIKTAQLQN